MYYDICLSWGESSLEFLKMCFSVVSRRKRLLVVFSWLFFGFMVFGALLASSGLVEVLPWPFEVFSLDVSNALVMALWIFSFNLVLSSFILLTASGAAFFVFPISFLLFRALLWGVLLSELPTPVFLVVIPTLVLEGEGYVFAATAGFGLGLSWFKPEWMFRGENFSRIEAFKRALREFVCLYAFVVMLLFVAAIVETATIVNVLF
jgi:hypothetical protein